MQQFEAEALLEMWKRFLSELYLPVYSQKSNEFYDLFDGFHQSIKILVYKGEKARYQRMKVINQIICAIHIIYGTWIRPHFRRIPSDPTRSQLGDLHTIFSVISFQRSNGSVLLKRKAHPLDES